MFSFNIVTKECKSAIYWTVNSVLLLDLPLGERKKVINFSKASKVASALPN